MKFFYILFLFLIAAQLIGCQPQGTEKPITLMDRIEAHHTAPDRDLADSITQAIVNEPGLASGQPEILIGAIKIAAHHYMRERMRRLITMHLRNTGSEELPDELLRLAQIIEENIRDHTLSAFIYLSYIEEFPDDLRWDSIAAKVPAEYTTTEDLIAEAAGKIYGLDKMLLSRVEANKFMQYTELYALSKPHNPNSAEYLFQASEVARSVEMYQRSLYNTRWILRDYPEHEAAARALFFKAFTISESGDDPERAIQLFTRFIIEYPSHPLAESARILIEIGPMTEEQALERLRQNAEREQE